MGRRQRLWSQPCCAFAVQGPQTSPSPGSSLSFLMCTWEWGYKNSKVEEKSVCVSHSRRDHMHRCELAQDQWPLCRRGSWLVQAFPRACGGEGRGREGQVGWQGRWGPTCASLLLESPKPGAGSWVTQEAMSHWFLPSPPKTT